MPSDSNKNIPVPRPPVVAVMGHIDHGKSTLLLYIRNNLTAKSAKNAGRPAELKEAGGITQHVSAYEVEHSAKDGKVHKITFLDTPGHEAFSGIRKRGAKVADVAVLVVSAEDGVKPQTVEALKSITESKTPYIVAINKIDKESANIDRTKQSLAEHEVYVEGYGGTTPVVAISSKTGEGVEELLDMIILISEMEELTGDPSVPGSGIVIESNRDVKKGISATCIIKSGVVHKGHFIVSGTSFSPIRIMENYRGEQVEQSSFSSPVKIIGWDSLPEAGSQFKTFQKRDDAMSEVEENLANKNQKGSASEVSFSDATYKIPVIIKADTLGSLEAVTQEIKKLSNEKVSAEVVSTGIGTISENDVRLAEGSKKALVLGFGVTMDNQAKNLSERSGTIIKTFDIIYKLSEWLSEEMEKSSPKTLVEESTGVAKVLKVFSKVRDRQILGARVEDGSIKLGATVKILRRESEIGQGKIRELQQQKKSTEEVSAGVEFGAMIESKVEIAPGDKVESFIVVEK